MLKKLLLAFIALNVLAVAALAIAFPTKDKHVFRNSSGMHVEDFYKRHWALLPPTQWGLEPNPSRLIGCGPTSSGSYGVRRFGFIGIVEHEGWQTTQEEWEKAQKIGRHESN